MTFSRVEMVRFSASINRPKRKPSLACLFLFIFLSLLFNLTAAAQLWAFAHSASAYRVQLCADTGDSQCQSERRNVLF